MFRRICLAVLCCATAWATGATRTVLAASSESDRVLVSAVAARVFAEAEAPSELSWPPLVAISDSAEIGVFAALCDVQSGRPPVVADGGRLEWLALEDAKRAETDARLQPVVIVTQGMLDNIIGGREERLAAALSHAAAHLLLGHVDEVPQGTLLTADMIAPQQEAEADVQGLKLALAADFPLRSVLACYLAMRDHAAGASFEGTNAAHASWDDRIAALDAQQEELLRSISAFEAGVQFLMIEHYALAEQCFDQVTKEFPKAHEAWANLGYARLMLYSDALEAEDLRAYDVGQLAVGGFYSRPESLTVKFRRLQDELWYDAVGALRQALILNPDLLLPKAGLAVAYLLHPDGKDAARAASFATQVMATLDAGGGEAMEPLARGAMLVNVGVALLEAGDAGAAARLFDEALALAEAGQACGARTVLVSAIRHNQARMRAASADAAERRAALADFEAALAGCQPAATWWTLTYERYAALCGKLGVPPRSAEEFRAGQAGGHGVVAGLAVGEAPIVALGDSIDAAKAALGDEPSAGERREVHKRTNIRRLAYDALGVELLCAGRVVAIRLQAGGNAAIALASPGGDAPRMLRVGMSLAELEAALSDDANHWEERAGADGGAVFRFYACLGLGVRMDGEAVAELVVAQPPR